MSLMNLQLQCGASVLSIGSLLGSCWNSEGSCHNPKTQIARLGIWVDSARQGVDHQTAPWASMNKTSRDWRRLFGPLRTDWTKVVENYLTETELNIGTRKDPVSLQNNLYGVR